MENHNLLISWENRRYFWRSKEHPSHPVPKGCHAKGSSVAQMIKQVQRLAIVIG